MTKKIKKADTFGQKNEWQIDQDITQKIKIEANKMDLYDPIYEETIDDLIMVLHKMGYLKLED